MATEGGPNIITDGLVLALDAANSKSYPGSGTTWKDLSGNGNNVTLTNSPTFNSDNKGSFIFDGTNDYAIKSSNSTFALDSGDYTINGWYYPNSLEASQTSLSLGVGGSQMRWVVGVGRANGTIFFGTGTGTWAWAQNTTSPTGVINSSEWSNVTVVKDGTTLRIYVNSTSVHTVSSFNFGSGQSGNLYVGTYFLDYNSDGSYFNGRVSNIEFHQNKALSQSEILQNYNATKQRFK